MTDASRAAIVRRCFDAYRTKDRASIEAVLADDFRFTSPYDDAIDRATYFVRCWTNSGRIRQHDIERIFVQGDSAYVTYLAHIVDGSEFRNTEFFTFRDDKITSVTVYFGASYRDGRFVAQAPPG
ncbi:MAG: nuclear transport factor 2 family protein [Alphaproteobacteria bacterium]|nr:nuclear transport factor 2 family protein [Alphaproteobacteria bacterium]